jgi:2'-5' RNA ligase
VPRSAARVLHADLEPYRAAYPGIRWTIPDAYHLTLLFLGAVDPPHADRLGAIARDVAVAGRPFAITAEGVGGTGRGDDGIAWLQVSVGATEVARLANALASRIPDEMAGDDRAPRRAPSAHLTIARRVPEAARAEMAAERLGPVAVAWTADRLVLLRSHLGTDRARYGTLALARLGERT